MLEALNQYSGAINAVLQLAMVGIWLVYFQILTHAYRRQRQTKVLVNRHVGADGEERCVLGNMSPEPIFVDLVVASMDVAGQVRRSALADTVDGEQGSVSRTGPVQQGETRELGSFERIVDELGPDCALEDVRSIELTVIAAYGPEDMPVGATRTFRAARGRGVSFVPQETNTRQARGKKERRELADMADCFGSFSNDIPASDEDKQISGN